jgi:hypothetical protein
VPRTPLVLRASPAKAPPAPESYEATQPSEIQDQTQPSPVLAPDEAHGPHGPQGDFNAHDWWAEQREAARQEDAEEQGW